MKSVLTIFFVLLAATSYASQSAITDTGEEVILYDDGTWTYSDAQKKTSKIEINRKKFEKPKASTFKLKSTRNNTIYWINTNKWTFTKQVDNTASEYEFKLKDKDLYGMAINEEIEIPLVSLANIAFENAREAAPDVKIMQQEYRIVNGVKVLYMVMAGTIEGMKVTYMGYYYSDASGTTQLLTYTATNLIDKYRSEIEDFLNGFGSR